MKSGAATSEQPAPQPAVTFAHLRKVVLVLLYILTSSCLIRFNKFLMEPERFPYSMFLTSCHMMMSLLLCLTFYFVKPSSFPGLAHCAGNESLVLKRMLPIGLSFAVSLYTSNQAYFYCNVTFLQFMKESNVIICFLMSFAAGLQTVSRPQIAVICWILFGASMAVQGEMHFVFIGFVFQIVSQFAECLRVVLGEVVLAGGGLKLDPLSYTTLVSPACLVALTVGNVATWDHAILGALGEWWMYVLPNSMLAFVLNLLVATMIKELSAVGFVLGGLCKDVAIVLFSTLAFGEPVTAQQCLGFSTTLTGVALWSYLKVFPGDVERRLMALGLGGGARGKAFSYITVNGPDEPSVTEPARVYGQTKAHAHDEEAPRGTPRCAASSASASAAGAALPDGLRGATVRFASPATP